MDYRDYESGGDANFFWFRAKRELTKILTERLGLKGRPRILDIGAGTGEDVEVLKEFGEMYVVDTETAALNMIDERLIKEKTHCDVCRLPYPEGFFDAAVAFDVLEHVEDDSAAVAEITRVLKPGGAFVFTVPAFNFLYGGHDRALGHFRRYGKREIKSLMSGLTAEDLGYWMCLLFLPLTLQRIFERNKDVSSVQFSGFNRYLNAFFYKLLSMENLLIKKGIHLPMGSTIYGICRKETE